MTTYTTSWGARLNYSGEQPLDEQADIDRAALRSGLRPPPGPVEGCSTCESYGRYGPSHWPSIRCRSGMRIHCTCDTCF